METGLARIAKKNVSKRRRIDFELKMPKAQQVILMGDFNQWNPKTHPMRKEENGAWRKTVMIYPGRYEYRFLNHPPPWRIQKGFTYIKVLKPLSGQEISLKSARLCR